MEENNVIKQLQDRLPWEEFFSEMEANGFTKWKSINASKLSKSSKSDDLIQSGTIMLVGDVIQSGTIRDPSHLHVIPHVVFRPKTENQLQKIIIASQKHEIPITFASGKTGLSGGYVNHAIIVDLENLVEA